MAEKKARMTAVEIPEVPAAAETADEIGVKRKIMLDAYGGRYAACGNCGCRLVNVEERVRCRYCWCCGKRVIW